MNIIVRSIQRENQIWSYNLFVVVLILKFIINLRFLIIVSIQFQCNISILFFNLLWPRDALVGSLGDFILEELMQSLSAD